MSGQAIARGKTGGLWSVRDVLDRRLGEDDDEDVSTGGEILTALRPWQPIGRLAG
jgi:hypothetical protein